MKRLTLLFGLLLLFGQCSNKSDLNDKIKEEETTTAEKPKLIIDIRTLINKNSSEVEKILGKPDKSEKMNGYPCKNANCVRKYYQTGKYEIIFKRKLVDRITINKVEPLVMHESLIETLGLDHKQPTFYNPESVIRWTNIENINEIGFYGYNKLEYILIQVTDPN